MDEITDLLSEKRLAKYKASVKKMPLLVICLIVNWRNLFILRCHILKSSCETRLIRYFLNIWVMTGFSKMSILSAEIRII